MIALIQQILIGIAAAVALSIPIGYGLTRLLALEPPWRRTPSQTRDVAPSVEPGPEEVLVAKLGPVGQSIAHLVDDLDRMGIVLLRAGDHGKQLAVLMSVEQYELLHATEILARDPDHLMSLVSARTGDDVDPEINWRTALA